MILRKEVLKTIVSNSVTMPQVPVKMLLKSGFNALHVPFQLSAAERKLENRRVIRFVEATQISIDLMLIPLRLLSCFRKNAIIL